MAIISRSLSKNKRFFVWLIMLCAEIATSSCNLQDTEERVPQKVLQVRLKKNPTTLDPARIVDLDGARIAAKLYNGLVTFDEQLMPVPDLAESWHLADDRRTYSFHLRRGVLFHDGHELTADDVLYSFTRVLSPSTRSPRTWVLSRIAGAQQYMSGQAASIAGLRKQGRYEIVIELSEPFAPFLCLLGLTTASIISCHSMPSDRDDSVFLPCGTGPYMLSAWQHNQYLVLKAHERYWAGSPALDGIRYAIIPENFTALVAFEKGDIDVLPEITSADYDRLAQDPIRRACMLWQAPLNTYYLGLNCQMPPLTDVRVRRALHHALDKHTILQRILGGRGSVACGPLPPLLRRVHIPDRYPYDPAAARALLQDAGYPHGFALTVYQVTDTETLDVMQAVQGYLARVGITVTIVQLEWSAFLEKVARGEVPAFWLSWWADYPDAENFLFPLFHSQNWGPGGNRCRFRDPAIDERIVAAVRIGDGSQRHAAYQDIEQMIIDQAPFVWGWHKSVVGIRQPWVVGITLPPLPVMERWDRVVITEEKQEKPPGRG
ncbi:MAG: ABC transporter substrate-binding protein [Desulfobacterota bacterium]|nr:ABC transporter substrate-binding protein [Thermodesulfobacteriota bacterium]